MDEIDRKIVAVLRENARVSMRDLGNIISLSNTATTERVRRLEENGVICGYHANIRHSLLGKPVRAIILLEFKHEVRVNSSGFSRYVKDNEHIFAVYPILSGGFDYMVEVYCKDTSELHDIQQQLYVFGSTTTYLAGEK